MHYELRILISLQHLEQKEKAEYRVDIQLITVLYFVEYSRLELLTSTLPVLRSTG